MDFFKVSLREQLAAMQTKQDFPLKDGQMVHGQIKKIFPGQMAEVQIGDRQIMAKLEVPLKAGENYYFQVRVDEPHYQLKIITGLTNSGEMGSGQLTRLIEAMELPKSKEMNALLSFIIKQKIPLQRENLLQADLLMKQIPTEKHPQAFAAIQKMAELKLPFSESVFEALFNVQPKEGVGRILQSFKEALLEDKSGAQAIKQSILASIEKLERPYVDTVGNVLAGKLLLKLLDSTESPELRFSIIQLLKKEGILPVTTSLANISQLLADVAVKAVAKNMQPETQQVTQVPVSQSTDVFIGKFKKMIENSIAEPFRKNGDLIKQLLTPLGFQSQKEITEKVEQLVRVTANSQNIALQKLLQSAEIAVDKALDGNAMGKALQTVMRTFGFNYEASLAEADTNLARFADAFKPQLIALSQDQTVSPTVREHAQSIVARMNGFVLLSGENGLQHQLMMPVPLEFFGKRIDATLQWNGKMKEDGKIDPEFARILFYLDLHSLKETVIDMQVQNRVVSLTVFNENPALKVIGTSIESKLVEGLANAGYRLSGLLFKRLPEEKRRDFPRFQQVTTATEGVDFRI